MRKPVLTFSLLILAVIAFAQETSRDSMPWQPSAGPTAKRLNYGLSLGTEFTASTWYGTGFTTWVTPSVSYGLTPKLRIGGGISFQTTNYQLPVGWRATEYGANGWNNFTTATIFLNGSYQVNDRLMIFGSAFKQVPLTSDPLPYNPFSPISSKGAQGVDFNVGYRIGRNVHIQAGFRYSEGLNPWYQNSVYGDPFGSPFGSPVGTPFGQRGYGFGY